MYKITHIAIYSPNFKSDNFFPLSLDIFIYFRSDTFYFWYNNVNSDLQNNCGFFNANHKIVTCYYFSNFHNKTTTIRISVEYL